jgi:RNA polymerase sigma-70 factor (ECF subfamily)
LIEDARDDALLALLREQAPRHMALARRLLGNEEDASDVLQEAWIRVWRHRRALLAQEAAPGWVRRILVRECYRALQRRGWRRVFVLAFPLPEARASGPDPEVMHEERARLEALRMAVEDLSARQRLVWGLRFDEGWSVGEIAEATGLGIETVRTHLVRALTRIRARMEERDAV